MLKTAEKLRIMLLEFSFVFSVSASKPMRSIDVIADQRFPGLEIVVKEAFNGLGLEPMTEASHQPLYLIFMPWNARCGSSP